MAEISITERDEQRLEEVREDLAAAFVDDYGHVRRRDAVEYLLDTYTPPGEPVAGAFGEGADPVADATYPELQRVASDVPAVPGSGIDADEMRGRLVSELGTLELADRLAAVRESADAEGTDGSADAGAPTGPAGDADGEPADDPAGEAPATTPGDGDAVTDDGGPPAHGEAVPAGDGDGAGGAEAGAGDDADDADDAGGVDAPPTADAGASLSATSRLLEEHADKWSEAEAGDEPYEVELPDGSTERVRTRDDIRRILFKNY